MNTLPSRLLGRGAASRGRLRCCGLSRGLCVCATREGLRHLPEAWVGAAVCAVCGAGSGLLQRRPHPWVAFLLQGLKSPSCTRAVCVLPPYVDGASLGGRTVAGSGPQVGRGCGKERGGEPAPCSSIRQVGCWAPAGRGTPSSGRHHHWPWLMRAGRDQQTRP